MLRVCAGCSLSLLSQVWYCCCLHFHLLILFYREFKQRLDNFAHIETQHILEIQKESNNQLQQANVILRASEERLAVTLNSIGDGVIATDSKGLVVLMNPLAELFTGWTKADAIGRPVDDIFNIVKQGHPPTRFTSNSCNPGAWCGTDNWPTILCSSHVMAASVLLPIAAHRFVTAKTELKEPFWCSVT